MVKSLQFSVIIPTCNRNDLLAKCLDKLAPNVQTINADNYEVIVTDDGKVNEAKAFIKANYNWVKWLQGPKQGPAANRNNGAKYANGSWLIFLDDDIIPSFELLNVYKTAIGKNPTCSVFEGAIHPNNWELFKSDLYECPVNLNGGSFWSANICIRRRLFAIIEGFDDRFIIAAQEDQDLFLRLQCKSKIIFLPNAFVIHPIRKIKLFSPLKIIYLVIKNYVFFVLKHNIYTNIFHLTLSKSLEFIRTLKKRRSILKSLDDIYRFFFGLPLMMILYIKYKYFANN